MALEMKVYREIRGYEAKVMFGMSWRQLAAMAIGVPFAASVFAMISVALHNTGASWSHATNMATYAMFVILLPFAAWGWWRPMSLKPEKYIGYLIRHNFTRKVILYADCYSTQSVASHARPGGGESAGAGDGAGKTRKKKQARPKEH